MMNGSFRQSQDSRRGSSRGGFRGGFRGGYGYPQQFFHNNYFPYQNPNFISVQPGGVAYNGRQYAYPKLKEILDQYELKEQRDMERHEEEKLDRLADKISSKTVASDARVAQLEAELRQLRTQFPQNQAPPFAVGQHVVAQAPPVVAHPQSVIDEHRLNDIVARAMQGAEHALAERVVQSVKDSIEEGVKKCVQDALTERGRSKKPRSASPAMRGRKVARPRPAQIKIYTSDEGESSDELPEAARDETQAPHSADSSPAPRAREPNGKREPPEEESGRTKSPGRPRKTSNAAQEKADRIEEIIADLKTQYKGKDNDAKLRVRWRELTNDRFPVTRAEAYKTMAELIEAENH